MFIKNFFSVIILSTLLIASCTRPAHAVVGVMAWNPPLVGYGLLGYSAGAVIAVPGAAIVKSESLLVKITGGAMIGVGVFLAAVSFIALPDGSSSLEFSPISLDKQQALNLTQSEIETYNEEIDQVNLIVQQVISDLNEIESPTVEDSVNAFKNYDGLLSPETMSVLKVIALDLTNS